MDFGKILEEWENKDKKRNFNDLLNKYPPKKAEKETEPADSRKKAIRRREYLRKLKPQRTLDLHGFKKDDAIAALNSFIIESRQLGFKKVLIIPGKGIHSKNGPVLRNAVIKYLEQNRLTGEFGPAEREYGGKGAVWVILR
ncbi:MAG: DNA mismatch repair protein MutS [Spirochaetes bacterium]|nr:MAG: DNA mismatch repair protein MutS [Spirochaetota bacterium]